MSHKNFMALEHERVDITRAHIDAVICEAAGHARVPSLYEVIEKGRAMGEPSHCLRCLEIIDLDGKVNIKQRQARELVEVVVRIVGALVADSPIPTLGSSAAALASE